MLGRITFYNHTYGFITVTMQPKSPIEAPTQEQFFFHRSNFQGEPVIGAFVVFSLAPGIAEGKKVQAIGIRFATVQEVSSIGGTN